MFIITYQLAIIHSLAKGPSIAWGIRTRTDEFSSLCVMTGCGKSVDKLKKTHQSSWLKLISRVEEDLKTIFGVK